MSVNRKQRLELKRKHPRKYRALLKAQRVQGARYRNQHRKEFNARARRLRRRPDQMLRASRYMKKRRRTDPKFRARQNRCSMRRYKRIRADPKLWAALQAKERRRQRARTAERRRLRSIA